VSSQFSLEFISGGSTFDAGNNLNIEADGDTEFFSRNDIGLLSADQLTFTFSKSECKTKQNRKRGKKEKEPDMEDSNLLADITRRD